MTDIEWTRGDDGSKGETWNPSLGCSKISPGCDRCYAVQTATVRAGHPNEKIKLAFEGLTHRTDDGLDWTGRVNTIPDRLDKPFTWKKPRRIFVNSLSDLFHEQITDNFIADVFAVMAATPQHTYQLLTKRHGRMKALLNNKLWWQYNFAAACRNRGISYATSASWGEFDRDTASLPNVWLGISVEDQKWADIRIPALLETPAAVRFLSCEPLLGPIDLSPWIGANHGEGAVPRRGYLLGSPTGSALDRFSRAGLASGNHAGESMESPADSVPGCCAEASGEPGRASWLPPGPGTAGRHQDALPGPSSGVASHLRLDSGRVDDQPPQRGQDGQQAGQPGTRDTRGAVQACADGSASWASRPVGGGEPDGDTVDHAGAGDLLAPGTGGEPARDSRRLRGCDADGLTDSARQPSISWVICGGESGPGARPMHPTWARSLRDQCVAAGIPLHFKQWGSWGPAPWRVDQEPGESIEEYKARSEAVCATHSYAVWADQYGHQPQAPTHKPWSGERTSLPDEQAPIRRWRKKIDGRELDGREWNEFPSQPVGGVL